MPQPLKTAREMYPLVEKYIEGNLTQKAFCASHDITTSQLNYWLAKFRRLAARPKVPASPEHLSAPDHARSCDFIEITPPGPPAEQALLEVLYPHGVRLRLFTPVAPSYLERLLVLEGPGA